jgi:hypothetical protein
MSIYERHEKISKRCRSFQKLVFNIYIDFIGEISVGFRICIRAKHQILRHTYRRMVP